MAKFGHTTMTTILGSLPTQCNCQPQFNGSPRSDAAAKGVSALRLGRLTKQHTRPLLPACMCSMHRHQASLNPSQIDNIANEKREADLGNGLEKRNIGITNGCAKACMNAEQQQLLMAAVCKQASPAKVHPPWPAPCTAAGSRAAHPACAQSCRC